MKFSHPNILSVIAASIILASCADNNPKQQQGPAPATPVTVAKVILGNPVYYNEYPGNVVALNEIKITPQVSGYITGIYFKDGQQVKKGQRLYSIDAQVYRANYDQSIANLQVQEANLVKAQKDAARYEELDQHDAIAKQQVDYAKAALQVSQKQVAAAKANVASLQSNVQFSTINAPFTGTIGISQVKKGTAVVAGQSLLNTVSTDNPIGVDFNVDEKEIVRFMQIEKKGSNPSDSLFLLELPDQSMYAIPGKISFIDRAVDPNTGTIKVRLTFQNNDHFLRDGMSCNIHVKNNSSVQQMIIPYKAVTEQLGEFSVFVVGDSSKVESRRVTLGQKLGNKIIVLEGLHQGESIVSEGVQNLQEGMKVQAVTAGQTQHP